jgi:hypothetical protein
VIAGKQSLRTIKLGIGMRSKKKEEFGSLIRRSCSHRRKKREADEQDFPFLYECGSWAEWINVNLTVFVLNFCCSIAFK